MTILPIHLSGRHSPLFFLRVVEGRFPGAEIDLHAGANVLGRQDGPRVDVDLTHQEYPDRVWVSRRHALLSVADHHVTVEDLGSLNGTWVNRVEVPRGTRVPV